MARFVLLSYDSHTSVGRFFCARSSVVSYVGPGIPDSAFIASAEPLARDVLCRHCGYNLRGHRPSQKCSECGTPVRDSLRPDELQYADPDWLDKLRLGTMLVWWSMAVGLLSVVTFAALRPSSAFIPVRKLLLLVLYVLQTYGIVLLTTQEPRTSLHEDPVTLRRVIRVCAVLGLTGRLVSLSPLPRAGSSILMGLSILLSVASLVMLFGQLVFLRHFAQRIPDHGLARSTGIVMWGGVTVLALLITVSMHAAIAPGRSAPGAAGGGRAHTIACALLLLMLVLGIWYLILLLRYRRAFAVAAEFARDNATPDIEDAAGKPPVARPLG